jgi:IS5 family transposase
VLAWFQARITTLVAGERQGGDVKALLTAANAARILGVTPADRHDAALLASPLDALAVVDEPMTVHLDRGYDSARTRQRLADRGLSAEIARRRVPTPITAGLRWVVERTTAWTDAHKTLVWCSERLARVIAFWITFSAVIITAGRLVREAWARYGWDTRPRRRP